jgi:hypothetical protein
MNETPKQHLVVGLEVNYIGHDKKLHKGKITEVFPGINNCRIESNDGQASAIAAYSETGEVNTFSFPSASAKAEKNKEANK